MALRLPDGELHLVLDNYATHKASRCALGSPPTPRIVVYFTPTHASWMNLVEVWFGIIESQAIHRGTFNSVTTELSAKNPGLLRRMERPRPPLRLDQDRRPDPQESQPSEHFHNRRAPRSRAVAPETRCQRRVRWSLTTRVGGDAACAHVDLGNRLGNRLRIDQSHLTT